MKTLFTTNQTQDFEKFSFDVLTAEELAFVKGGDAKEEDAYADPLP
jgi:hypothetical protein